MKWLCSIVSARGSRTPQPKRHPARGRAGQAAALQTSRFPLCVSLCSLWLILFLFSSTAHAQGPLLIKEVISREVGIFNGQGPDNQVISREVSMYVEWGRDNQVISREYSLVMVNPAPPPIVSNTLIAATASPSGHTVTLDWSTYNQWAVRDVSYYAIYYSLSPFTTVTGMTPYVIIPGETLSATFTGLTEWVDHFFAVVPVDGLGNFEPNILYKGVYVLMPEVISRETGIFIGQGPDKQVISREYSLNYVDTNAPPRINNTDITMTVSPMGDTVTVNWSPYNQWAVRDVSHYAIYYALAPFTTVTGMTPFAIIPGETLTTTFTGLTEWVDHYFAVVPVDGLGNFNPDVLYRAAYVLFPQMISREVGLFIGQGPDNQIISREYTFVRADTNIPAAVTYSGSPYSPLASSNAYGAIDLDWSFYNEWAERDIVRYRIYVSTQFFGDVSSMTPHAFSTNGKLIDTITNLPCEEILYTAVVAEDTLGQFDPVVFSRSSKASVCELGEVSNLVANATYDSIQYNWDLGGIGTDLRFFIDYFRVYFNGSLTPVVVPGTNFTWTATGLDPDRAYDIRIATVDIYETESPGNELTTRTLPFYTHVAHDHAGNYTNSPANFVNGANRGQGFLPWQIFLGAGATAVLGDSRDGSGDINSRNVRAFRLYGGPTQTYADAIRPFEHRLFPGDTFQTTIAYNWNGGARGVNILDENYNQLMNVNFGGGDQLSFLWGTQNVMNLSAFYSPTTILTVAVTQLEDFQLQARITRNDGYVAELTSTGLTASAAMVKYYNGGHSSDNINYALYANNLTIQRKQPLAQCNLIISEVVEGSSNNKAIELFNGSDQSINLSADNYNIQMYFNGVVTAGTTIALSGVIPSRGTFVLSHSSAAAEMLAEADQTIGGSWYNGNDPIVLRRGVITVDSVGQIGITNDFNLNITLVRKPEVYLGETDPYDAFDPNVEWITYPLNTFEHLGQHDMLCQSGDVDGDGLPNDWENLYFGGITNATSSHPAGNPEYTVEQAYIADINPTNPAASFPFAEIYQAIPGQIVDIIVDPTSTARVYRLVWTTNLLAQPQQWMLVPPEQPGTGATVIFPATNAGYYRTGVRLP